MKYALLFLLLFPLTASAALLFNGTSQSTNHGNVLDQTTNSFTVVAWVYPRTVGPIQCSVSKRNGSGTGYALCYGNSTNKFEYINHDGTTQRIVESPGTYPINSWYCVAGVTDPPNSTISLYVNGVLVQTGATVNSLTNAQAFLIGSSGDNFWWNGQVAEVRVFSRAVPVQEIRGLCSGNIAMGPGLTGYFPLWTDGPAVDLSAGRHLGALIANPQRGFGHPPVPRYGPTKK